MNVRNRDFEPPPSPTAEQARIGLDLFVARVRARYGSKLEGVYLYGSRARGDHRPDSDADVAVVIDDGDWSDVAETVSLAEESFEILVDQSLDIQPRAIAASHWRDPQLDREAWLIHRIKTDARRVDPSK